jgi:mono/diheme cytochrome c family protein
MSELSAAAAAALGVPEAIVQRSAAARAAETGLSVDEVLTAWAGGGDVPAAAAAEAPAPPAAAELAVEEEVAPDQAADEPSAPSTPAEEPVTQVAAAAAQPVTVTRSPVPAEVTPAQAAGLPEVITVPTAGIRERMNLAVPRWLSAVMLIIPVFALIALGSSATGECGEATQLTADVVTGEIVNCDGSEFTGSGAGDGGSDFLAMGEALYTGAPNCAGCHGATGGGGVGPGFGGVLTTFGVCQDHIEWVALGTSGFQAAGESTYGDTNKPVGGGGVMPSFGNSLSAEQLASVVAYERVRFGGGDPAQTLVDCGLAPADGAEEGDGGVPGEGAPAEGEGTTTTTVSGG